MFRVHANLHKKQTGEIRYEKKHYEFCSKVRNLGVDMRLPDIVVDGNHAERVVGGVAQWLKGRRFLAGGLSLI